MTEALRASTDALTNTSATGNVVRMSERRNLVRKTIAAARPVMPDAASRQAKLRVAMKIWSEGKSIAHSCAARYLEICGIDDRAGDAVALRYHPAVLHEPTRRYMPALLAPVHDLNNKLVGIHRTYLLPDGSGRAKVEAGEDRRMLGDCFGSYIQVRPMQGFRLAITESVEMALIVQQSCHDLPVWAAMTLGNFKAPLPPSVRELIVCTDEKARASGVAARLVMDAVRAHINQGRTVLVAHPLPRVSLDDTRRG